MTEGIHKILILSDTNNKPVKMYLDQAPKLAKGFIRLGHDVRHLSYCSILSQLSHFKSRSLSGFFCKRKADEIIAQFVRQYKPDIIFVGFAKYLDSATISLLREEVPSAVLVGGDGDPWPKLQKDKRIETAMGLDIMTATNDGEFLQDYRDAGVRRCVFLPNICDPDTDHRYDVGEQWKSDILFTGQLKLKRDYPTSDIRYQLANKLIGMKNCSIYGCLGRPKIGGLDYFYAISGAKIGVNSNVRDDIKFYHSDRLTHYLACGTFVMAKRMKDCDGLYKDGQHLKFFDTVEEFFELADWYLKHEEERKKIADAGMKWMHEQFNCVKIAGYIVDMVDKGQYQAPWGTFS
jgi:glycosyltransferase involved in cell wall biosynthesis